MPADLAVLFLDRSRHLLGVEYRAKLHHAVDALPAGALWWRAGDASNSVGNLLLHLTGNIRQWVGSGIGSTMDQRDRDAEFAARAAAPAAELLADLDRALDEVDGVLAALAPSALGEQRTIQGRDVLVFDAVYHVVEHFSMHVGQIILLSKMHAPGAVQFYEDAGGAAHPRVPEKWGSPSP